MDLLKKKDELIIKREKERVIIIDLQNRIDQIQEELQKAGQEHNKMQAQIELINELEADNDSTTRTDT